MGQQHIARIRSVGILNQMSNGLYANRFNGNICQITSTFGVTCYSNVGLHLARRYAVIVESFSLWAKSVDFSNMVLISLNFYLSRQYLDLHNPELVSMP